MRLAAAVAALVLVCSAGAAGSVPSASPSILPAATSGEPPSAAPTETLAAPTPFAIGLCHPGEVAIETVYWGGTTAEMGGGATLVDVGSQPCEVGGRPTKVRILDRRGQPLDLEVEPFNDDLQVGNVLVLPDDPDPAPSEALFPGQVGIQLYWTNWCGTWSREGTLVLTLPVVGELRAPFAGLSAPRCNTPGAPSVLQVGPVITPR